MIYQMIDVIESMTLGKMDQAMQRYMQLMGCSYAEARVTVEAFAPFVVLPDQKPTEATQQAPETILEPSQQDTRSLGTIIKDAWDQTKQVPETSQEKDVKRDGFDRPIKPEIDKWVITSVEPTNSRDYWDWFNSEDYALSTARRLIDKGHTQVRISRVIAETKEKITLTIEL